jgi:formate dehydrogenase iron-sulfur subunit
MPTTSLELKAISATRHPTPAIKQTKEVAKLIDVSSCIGCKACEVACQEWNDLQAAEGRPFFGSYQTLPDLEANFWQLIKFNEVERDGRLVWNMTKYQCMHCEDPGCLRACPSPGAIVQYTNGIVDFVQENCIGCGYCITGCPFDVPRISKTTGKVYKCTLCSDRVEVGLEPACIKACPTNCLHFGTKDQLVQIANARVNQLKEQGYVSAAVYDPKGVDGTHVIYVLPHGDKPQEYGLPENPKVPLAVVLWKQPLKWLGGIMMLGGIFAAFTHYIRYGRKPEPPEAEAAGK